MTLLSQPDELASVCRTHLLEALGIGKPATHCRGSRQACHYDDLAFYDEKNSETLNA